MTPFQLGGLILLITFIVVGVSFTAYAFFNRFMEKEKERGAQFRALHQGQDDRTTGRPGEPPRPSE